MEDDLFKIIKNILDTQKLAALATSRQDKPYANLVAFAATEDIKNIIFSTITYTRKFANISANSAVAMLIDNGANLEQDFHRASAVTAIGNVEEVPEDTRERYLGIYLAKHPYLEDFVQSPTCILLNILVTKYCVVSQFQHVRELYLPE
jgi:nitroimidazol reductase NimA-like FMN-containing flavoprotein (pyridoxamine 5'-phosphate oxidase superfamily)